MTNTKITFEEVKKGLALKQRAIMMDRLMRDFGLEVDFVIDFCEKCENWGIEKQNEIKALFMQIMNNPPIEE